MFLDRCVKKADSCCEQKYTLTTTMCTLRADAKQTAGLHLTRTKQGARPPCPVNCFRQQPAERLASLPACTSTGTPPGCRGCPCWDQAGRHCYTPPVEQACWAWPSQYHASRAENLPACLHARVLCCRTVHCLNQCCRKTHHTDKGTSNADVNARTMGQHQRKHRDSMAEGPSMSRLGCIAYQPAS